MVGLGQFPALGTGLCVTSVLAPWPLDRVLACTRVTLSAHLRAWLCVSWPRTSPSMCLPVEGTGWWPVSSSLSPSPTAVTPHLPVPMVPCPVPASPWLPPAPSGHLVLTQPHTPGPRSLESLAGSLCEITVRGQDQCYSATTPCFCYPVGH